jgi:hypothetical protein
MYDSLSSGADKYFCVKCEDCKHEFLMWVAVNGKSRIKIAWYLPSRTGRITQRAQKKLGKIYPLRRIDSKNLRGSPLNMSQVPQHGTAKYPYRFLKFSDPTLRGLSLPRCWLIELIQQTSINLHLWGDTLSYDSEIQLWGLLRSGLVRLWRIIPLRCVPHNYKKALGFSGTVYPALVN